MTHRWADCIDYARVCRACGACHLWPFDLYVVLKQRAQALFNGGPYFCYAIPLGEVGWPQSLCDQTIQPSWR